MKKWHDLPFRVKLILVYSITIVVVVVAIALTLTLTASRQVVEDKKANLHLLTEQVLLNFSSTTESASQQLISMANSRGVASQMYAIHNQAEDEGSYQATQNLVYAINQMLNAQTSYDAVYVRLSNGRSYSNSYAPDSFVADASALLDHETYGANRYGKTVWTRSESGEVYMVRDVYNLIPIRHVGKLVARVRQGVLVNLGTYNASLHCAVVFLDRDGNATTLAGEGTPEMLTAAMQVEAQGAQEVTLGERYFVSVQQNQEWKAVGLLPESTLNTVSQAVIRTGMVIALLGIAVGAVSVLAATQRMTRQMRLLVRSMDEVAYGNMNSTVAVESKDEIGQMAVHFNRMIAQTRDLLARIVHEETRKSRAEYEMLEYKYRSLQSQINPHFIYNAMETVNALAKIDGNDEICDVVQHISAFFRQNTGNMQKRLITVEREFSSLKQYAHIYRHIHGDALSTPFACTQEAAQALIPTMILQPVLENALVHGITADSAVVEITATVIDEARLRITVHDNGAGMPPETVDKILYGAADEPQPSGQASAGIGMRNVRDRLRLIFGELAILSIQSTEGIGTLVTIEIPLMYDESEIPDAPGEGNP